MKTAVAVGNFDGVHLGHVHLLKTLQKLAAEKNLKPLALTFEPHPLTVVNPSKAPCRLTTPDEKRVLIEKTLGVELEVLPFDEDFASLEPQEFLERYLWERFKASLIVVGYDWRFGRNAEGNISTVKEFCNRKGCKVYEVKPFKVGGKTVSSSLVRKLLREAKIKEAALYLGRPYWIERKKESGMGLASRMGFPTLNFSDVDRLCLPNGVYAVSLEGLPAIAYLGYAPTLKSLENRILEVHVLSEKFIDDGDPYRIVFHKFLRGELTFKNAEDLARTVREDIKKAERIFLIT